MTRARQASDAPGYRAQMLRLAPLPEDALAAPVTRGTCGRDYDHTLVRVGDVHGGGTEHRCIECGDELVIDPDGTVILIGEPIDGGVQ